LAFSYDRSAKPLSEPFDPFIPASGSADDAVELEIAKSELDECICGI